VVRLCSVVKLSSVSGGEAHRPLDQGVCSWTPLRAKLPDPLLSSRSRAHHDACLATFLNFVPPLVKSSFFWSKALFPYMSECRDRSSKAPAPAWSLAAFGIEALIDCSRNLRFKSAESFHLLVRLLATSGASDSRCCFLALLQWLYIYF
jgi:hypothetical protein